MKSNPNPRTGINAFRVTERDIAMVRYTWDAGLATREQLQLLFFSEKNRARAQTRVGLLRNHGYFDQVPGRAPNSPAVFMVSRRAARGLRLVQSHEGTERRPRPVSQALLRHSLAVADCRVRFVLACREPGFKLIRWLGEEEVRPITASSGVIPDAYFQVERESAGGLLRSGMFLECEISEKSEKALQQKLQNLGTYYYFGDFKRAFESKSLRILILVRPEPGTSGERLVRRVTRIAEHLRMTVFRVAELESFLRLAPGDAFYAPIWGQPGVDGPVALFRKGEGMDE